MIEIITAAFTAGEVKTFMIQGEYLEILQAAYPVDVFMMDRTGAQLSTMRNAEASYFSRPGKYEVVQVSSALAQTVKIFIGSGDAGTRRTSGEVAVIDGSKARTIAGYAFIGAGASGPVAAQNAMVQLWNPAGSGKNLILENLKFSGGAAAPIDMGSYAVALTNLGVVAKSKLINSPSSPVAQVRNQANAGSLITVNMTSSYMPTSQVQEYEFREPIVIPPGFGFVVCNTTVNMNVLVAFEWMEDDI